MQYRVKSQAEELIVKTLKSRTAGYARSVAKKSLWQETQLDENEFTFALRELMRARLLTECTGGRLRFTTQGLLSVYG